MTCAPRRALPRTRMASAVVSPRRCVLLIEEMRSFSSPLVPLTFSLLPSCRSSLSVSYCSSHKRETNRTREQAQTQRERKKADFQRQRFRSLNLNQNNKLTFCHLLLSALSPLPSPVSLQQLARASCPPPSKTPSWAAPCSPRPERRPGPSGEGTPPSDAPCAEAPGAAPASRAPGAAALPPPRPPTPGPSRWRRWPRRGRRTSARTEGSPPSATFSGERRGGSGRAGRGCSAGSAGAPVWSSAPSARGAASRGCEGKEETAHWGREGRRGRARSSLSLCVAVN